jgi:ElaB/YqjD/DUF883 family membrane-anchored ribosome-binding protein
LLDAFTVRTGRGILQEEGYRMATSGKGPGTPGPDPQAGGASPGAGQSGGPQEHRAGERLRQAGEEVRDEIRHEAERASGKAESLAEEAKERAGRLFDDTRDRVRSAIDERKEGLAQDVGDFAHALRVSASDLEDHHKAYVAHYVEQAASSVEQIADTLHRQDLGDLVRHAESFARRQPGLFIGGAVAAGFALARFLKSSAERRTIEEPETEEREGRYGPTGSAQPMPSASTSSYAATPAERSSSMEDVSHGRL